MKKICIFLCLLLSLMSFGQENENHPVLPSKESIIIRTTSEGGIERGFNSIQAYYYPALSELEIECSGEGQVRVYLFNAINQLCAYSEYDSSHDSSTWLDVPECSGTYYIAIMTEHTYAEGVFEK